MTYIFRGRGKIEFCPFTSFQTGNSITAVISSGGGSSSYACGNTSEIKIAKSTHRAFDPKPREDPRCSQSSVCGTGIRTHLHRDDLPPSGNQRVSTDQTLREQTGGPGGGFPVRLGANQSCGAARHGKHVVGPAEISGADRHGADVPGQGRATSKTLSAGRTADPERWQAGRPGARVSGVRENRGWNFAGTRRAGRTRVSSARAAFGPDGSHRRHDAR